MIIQRDEVYNDSSDMPLRYDLFRPERSEALPLVVCIHGGGWISGGKEDHHEIARLLAANGYAAATPNYRLAPLHPYPAAVNDIQEFVRFARENANELRIDPDRVASLGNSAGGHLAAMAALSGPSPVNAAVAICPITDLTSPRERHLPISWAFLEEFMGVPFETNEKIFEEASPLFHVSPNSPPFLIVHGEDDDVVPVEQSDALSAALQKAGASVEYHRLPNELHSFSFAGWTQISELFVGFLNRQFSPSPVA